MPKISALPPLSSADVLDELPIVDDSAGATKKLTIADLKAIFTPIGTVLDYAGSTAPTGFLFCYGQEVSRTTYADLFTVLSTTYGVGDGSTTFNLPDLRGRVIAGKDDMGGTSANRLVDAGTTSLNGDVLGDAGGAETHTLITAEIPSHNHVVSTYNNGAGGGGAPLSSNNTGGPSSPVTGNTGGGGAHNNVQPTIILNKIIRY